MPIREKSIIIIGLTLVLLLFSIFLIADKILVNGYHQLEKRDTERNVKLAVKAVENEIDSLDNFVKDWAQWDESYDFIASGSQEYIDVNLVDLTFVSQRINFIMYTDLTGRIVYARAFDWEKRLEIPLTEEIAAKLAAVKPNDNRIPVLGINKGVLNLPEGQLLVAASAISNSTGTAPARGVLLVGRYVSYVEKEIIADRIQLPLDFARWDSGELLFDFVSAKPYLSNSDKVYVKPMDTNYVAGYTVLPDIYGQPALMLRVLVHRDISHQGQSMLNYFFIMLLVAGLIFGIVMLALLERNVISRLADLSGIVERITKSKDLSIRLPVTGKDELAELATNINDMLGALDEAQTRLRYVGQHDTLTGLYNRSFFEEYMEKTRDTSDSLQIIVADVDGLKLINDTLGHTSGDELLRMAAEVLKQACPEDAIIARFGGDEFAILLKNQPLDVGAELCQAIKDVVAQTNHETPGLTLSMSIGYSAGTLHANDVGELLKEADNYMYRDKLFHHRSTRSAIVQTLKKALEARDFITDGHADRLQDLVRLLGIEIGLSENRLSELQLFAQFHDIGKVGIPDGILFKPGRLNDEEMAIMRSHSEIGYRIARAAPDLVFIADWVLKHHEWWNGGGYPLGLKEEEIPLECRILALADAYDAMTNQRPYRAPMTKDEALAEIRKNAGVQFDPKLTQVFVAILAKLP